MTSANPIHQVQSNLFIPQSNTGLHNEMNSCSPSHNTRHYCRMKRATHRDIYIHLDTYRQTIIQFVLSRKCYLC